MFQLIPRGQVQFLRTTHLEVMPDSNAELDGITMRGVLSICKAGLFTGGWYVDPGLSALAPLWQFVCLAQSQDSRKTRRRRGYVARSIR